MLATSKRTSVSLALRLLSAFLTLSLLLLCLNAALPPNVHAATAAWVSLGAMSSARYSHTATLLLDGKVLVAGGKDSVGALKTVGLYDPIMNTWSAASDMAGSRYAHSASLLQNGKVLVVGGRNDTDALAATELYNPATNTWFPGPVLDNARSAHTATLLSDGTVLVIGGKNSAGEALNSVVLYTPAVSGPGTWTAKTNLTTARYAHTATLLPDGKVLVVGGKNTAGDSLTDVTIYDPGTNLWANDALDLTEARADHTTVLLRTGKVLVAGGESKELVGETSTIVYRNTSVLYDPAANTWTATAGPMNATRSKHTATLTPVGSLLVVGGLNEVGVLGNAESYDPIADAWSDAGNLSGIRQFHTTILLPFGDVLVLGGYNGADPLNTVDLFRPAEIGTWTLTSNSMKRARYAQQATILLDGRVLVTGGQDSNTILGNVDIYDPATGEWGSAPDMLAARIGHTMTLLLDGRVLVVGGQTAGVGQFLDSAEIYDPRTNTWAATGSMGAKRMFHTATLLPDGQVVVVGGMNRDFPLDTTETYNPASGTWYSTGKINPARYSHTATLMANDSILIVGGQNYSGYVAKTQLYIPSSSGYSWWDTSGDNLFVREGHSSILLPNGKVLVVGGNPPSGASLTSCELYDPSALLVDPPANPWKATGSLNKARTAFGMTLLSNGKVLVAGGFYSDATLMDRRVSSRIDVIAAGSALTEVEIYDPVSETWTTVASLNEARRSPSAILLPDGKVLVTGLDSLTNASAELYNMFGTSAFNSAWRPTLADIPTQKYNKPISLSGTQFRGFQLGEGAGGTTTGSTTNYPLAQLRRIDNNQVRWLPLDAKASFSDTTFPSVSLSSVLSGPAPVVVTIYVNGIPSEFKSFKVELIKNYLPLLKRAGTNKKFFVPLVNK